MLKFTAAFLRIVLLILLVLSLFLAGLFLAAITDNKIEQNPVEFTPSSAKVAKSLVKRFIYRISSEQSPSFFYFDEMEANAVLTLANRASDRFHGLVEIDENQIKLALRYDFFPTLLGDQFGLDIHIPAGKNLTLSHFQLGRLVLPGHWVLSAATTTANLILGQQQGSALLSSIKYVQTRPFQGRLILEPPGDISDRLSLASSRIKKLSARLNLFSDTDLTREYFATLQAIEQRYPEGSQVPLEYIVKALFEQVQQRSNSSNAIEHNRSALLALGVYLGTYHFEKLIGPIAPEGYKGHEMPIRVDLAKRGDLRLHFIYSATLKILSDQQAGFAIGEFKELLDSNTGGSGFSFVDLLADRAGVLFASAATSDAKTARDFQMRVLAHVHEGLLPDFADLDEGLSSEEFERRFGSVNSDAYQQQIENFDQRIQAMPLYSP